ncbi:hypothetical protein GE061_018155 [Apolygus lucorum]|uniref:Disks large-associated protein 5 n=1 Tax=Apolygus lucorum TaxID=248454 RepID=A0A8S9XEE1_APOLU|nr:hypothetical protein GE061_018155 [Apolygus lucorum]
MSSPPGPAFSPITPSGDRPATPGTVSPSPTKPSKTARPQSATPPSRSESPKSNGEEDAEWFPEPCPEPQRLLSDTSSMVTRHSLMVRLTRKIKKRTLACLICCSDVQVEMEKLHSRRNEVKERRKTLRQSVLDERRQTGLLSSESTPETDDRPGPRLRTRAANRMVDARNEAARLLKEKKARQALTAKEVKKVRPPFNNYIRVKHTGLSPFRSYQDASKRSRVAPWRAPPPKVPVPLSSGSQSKEKVGKKAAIVPSQSGSAGRTKLAQGTSYLPTKEMAAGVVMFGASHNAVKSVFKPPVKIQPIPFTTRPNRTQASKLEAEAEKPRIIPKSIPAKIASPKKNRLLKKPVPRITVKQTIPVVVGPPQPTRSTRIAKVKPHGMKKQPNEKDQQVEVKQPLKEVKNPPKRVSRHPVEPSSRTLRSSQATVQDFKENLMPQIKPPVVAKKSRKAKSVIHAGSKDGAEPVVSCPPVVEDRTKGLKDRSAQLTLETDRLRNLAEEWSSLRQTLSLPTTIADDIDATTGQTMLLISKKFIQYKGLIEGAHTDTRTTLEDLDGFWEMVYIQVRQLDEKYKELSHMKEKNWNVESPKIFKNVQIRQRKSNRRSKKATSNVKSSFQKFLAEKLKKKEESSDQDTNCTFSEQPSEERQLENPCVRVIESPLLSMSVDEAFETPSRSLNVTRKGSVTPRSTPRALENAKKALNSIRFSTTMMRLSTIFPEGPTS